jgi:predicted DNA-binding protein (MmcQ/YjbR family)
MSEPQQVRSPAGLEILSRLRGICAHLPEVAEEIDGFGHTSFRVGKKSFAILGESNGKPSLSIKSDLTTQDALIRTKRFERTPYIGQHGWVSLAEGEAPDWDEVADLMKDAYRMVAPKRLLKQMEPRGD